MGEFWAFETKETCSVPCGLTMAMGFWFHRQNWFHQTALAHSLPSPHISLHLSSASFSLVSSLIYHSFSHLRNFPTREFSLPFISHSSGSLIPSHWFLVFFFLLMNAHPWVTTSAPHLPWKSTCPQQNRGVTQDIIISILTFPKSLTSNKSNASKSSLFFIPNVSQHAERKVRIFFRQRNYREKTKVLSIKCVS